MLIDIDLKTWIIALVIALCIIVIALNVINARCNQSNVIETYAPVNYDILYGYDTYPILYNDNHDNIIEPNMAWLSRRGMLPWWNSTRFTRNMSYDIRGDIPPIHYDIGPWMVSPLI